MVESDVCVCEIHSTMITNTHHCNSNEASCHIVTICLYWTFTVQYMVSTKHTNHVQTINRYYCCIYSRRILLLSLSRFHSIFSWDFTGKLVFIIVISYIPRFVSLCYFAIYVWFVIMLNFCIVINKVIYLLYLLKVAQTPCYCEVSVDLVRHLGQKLNLIRVFVGF